MRAAFRLLGSALVLSVFVGCSSSDDDDADDKGETGGSAGSAPAGNGGASVAGSGGSAATSGAGDTAGSAGSSGTGPGAGNGGTSGTAGASGTAGTVSANPCDTALFCDDFESYTVGEVPKGKWAIRVNAGAVLVDGAERVSGAKAVKFTTQMKSDSKAAMMRVQDASIFPVAGNAFYGRMMYRLEAAPTASVHWTMITGIGTVPGQTYHAEYRYGGQQPVNGGNQLMANYETPDWYSNKATPGSDCWHHANGTVIPVATWSCIEWKFESNQMHFWLNGAALDDLSMVDHGQGCVNAANDYTWTAPTFAQLDLGWESYQTDDARTAYIDDVVISTTRVGCPN